MRRKFLKLTSALLTCLMVLAAILPIISIPSLAEVTVTYNSVSGPVTQKDARFGSDFYAEIYSVTYNKNLSLKDDYVSVTTESVDHSAKQIWHFTTPVINGVVNDWGTYAIQNAATGEYMIPQGASVSTSKTLECVSSIGGSYHYWWQMWELKDGSGFVLVNPNVKNGMPTHYLDISQSDNTKTQLYDYTNTNYDLEVFLIKKVAQPSVSDPLNTNVLGSDFYASLSSACYGTNVSLEGDTLKMASANTTDQNQIWHFQSSSAPGEAGKYTITSNEGKMVVPSGEAMVSSTVLTTVSSVSNPESKYWNIREYGGGYVITSVLRGTGEDIQNGSIMYFDISNSTNTKVQIYHESNKAYMPEVFKINKPSSFSADVREFSNNFNIAPSMVYEVNTAADLDEILTNSPAIAIMNAKTVNGEVVVADAGGNKVIAVSELFTKLSAKVIPAFRISNDYNATINAIKELKLKEYMCVSNNDDYLKAVRVIDPNAILVYDMSSAGVNQQMLDVRKETLGAGAKICILPATLASQRNTDFLNTLGVTVWYKAAKNSKAEYFSLVTAGGNGIVATNRSLLESVISSPAFKANTIIRPVNVIGHRGTPALFPENTIGGSTLAAKNGATIIENDIHMTTDGIIVVDHDGDFGVTKTGHDGRSIGKMTWAEVQQIKTFGKNSTYASGVTYTGSGESIPRLEDYFDAFKGTDTFLFIEIKGGDTAIVPALKKAMDDYTAKTGYDISKHCGVISFTAEIGKLVREQIPEVSAGWLNDSRDFDTIMQTATVNGTSYNPGSGAISEELVKALAVRGVFTWPWTYRSINGHSNIFDQHLLWGVAGLTTDDSYWAENYIRFLNTDKKIYSFAANESQAVTVTAEKYGAANKSTTTDYANVVYTPSGVTMTQVDGDITVTYENGELKANASGVATVIFNVEYTLNSGTKVNVCSEAVTVIVSEALGDSFNAHVTDVNANKNLCVDGETVASVGILTTDKKQAWQFVNDNGAYKIVNLYSGKVLTANGTSQGSLVTATGDVGSLNQRWAIIRQGQGYIISPCSSPDMVLGSTADSTAKAQLLTKNNSGDTIYTFSDVSDECLNSCEHTWSNYKQEGTEGNESHYKECSKCHERKEVRICTSNGSASCQAKAVCDTCGNAFGEKAAHNYDTKAWGYSQADGHAHLCTTEGCSEHDNVLPHTPDRAAPTETVPKKCSACGFVIETATGHVTHTYTELKYDSTGHWYKCTGCDQTTKKDVHIGTAATCQQRSICNICDQPYGSLASHKYSKDWINDANEHWNVCTCGDKQNKADHNYGTNDICDTCGYERAHMHAYGTEWQYDANEHWNVCSCGVKNTKNAHNFGTDDACDVCGYEKNHTHAYGTQYKSDATQHWNECACGAKTKEQNHIFSGGSDRCTVCGYDREHVHEYSELWSRNDKEHWHECACGTDVKDKQAHDFAGTDKCVTCGYEKGHVHRAEDEWVKNSEKHWKECSCGKKSDEAVHSYGNNDICDICLYERRHAHSYAEEWKSNSSHHFKECSCGDISEKEKHSYNDSNICTVCGYELIEETTFVPAIKESGCGSIVASGFAVVCMVAVFGTAVTCRKKKD